MPPASVIAQNILSATALLLGVGLAVVGIQRVTRINDVNALPPAEWITQVGELESLRAAAVGRYVTGREPGDRGIEVGAEGRLRFFRILEKGERSEPETKSRLGRINGKLNFVTLHEGAVEVINIDTLSYYRDVYRRAR